MWPLLAYFVLVILLVTTVLVVSYLLGPRHSEPATGQPYERGIVSEGSARARFSAGFLPDRCS
jgi:NADH-quinone oxidoreductase subunit A